MDKEISVILPCYNEESIIKNIIKEISNFSLNNLEYEFIFVDDGSKDNTLEILKNVLNKSKNKSITLLSYKPNKGKGYAIRTGVQKATGKFICFIDSDLAYSLNHLNILKKKLETCDVAIGCRGLSKENAQTTKIIRVLAGKCYNLFSRIILNLPYEDMQAGVKGYRNKIAKEIFSKQLINDFAFDVEVLYLTKKKGYKIKEIPATISKNHKNQVSQVNLIRDSLKMFSSLIKIKLNDLRGKYE